MIMNEGKELFFRPDQILFEQGQPSTGVYIILQGMIDLWHLNEDGKTVRIASLYDGELLGETSVIDQTNRSVTARASAPTKAIFISADTFRKSLSDPLVRFVVHTLSARLKNMYTATDNHRQKDQKDSASQSSESVPTVTISSDSPTIRDMLGDPIAVTHFPFQVGNGGVKGKEATISSNCLFLPLPNASHFAPAHFELVKRDGDIFVRDLGSALGTYVHGVKYSRYSDSAIAKLKPGRSLISIAGEDGMQLEFIITVPYVVA